MARSDGMARTVLNGRRRGGNRTAAQSTGVLRHRGRPRATRSPQTRAGGRPEDGDDMSDQLVQILIGNALVWCGGFLIGLSYGRKSRRWRRRRHEHNEARLRQGRQATWAIYGTGPI